MSLDVSEVREGVGRWTSIMWTVVRSDNHGRNVFLMYI